MTVAVMAAFGATVERADERTWVVEPQGYAATSYAIEPDASAASYFFAAAALTRWAGDGRGPGQPRRCRATSPSSTCSSAMGATRRAATPTRTDGGGRRAAARDRRRHGPDLRHRPDARRGGRLRRRARRAITGIGFIRRQGDRPHRGGRHRAAAGRASTPPRSPTGSSSHPGSIRPATDRRPTTTTAWP